MNDEISLSRLLKSSSAFGSVPVNEEPLVLFSAFVGALEGK